MTGAEDVSVTDADLEMLVRFRRDLHRIPELDFDLPKTKRYVRDVLEPLSCQVFSPTPSCICALFDAGCARTVAIRVDMDALPIEEATGVPFSSEHPGRMHACGHDAHMAMALAAAVWVDGIVRTRPGALPRNVMFVFQPAEETTGGARRVCESGVFAANQVERIFGFHVWPDLPWGTLASRPGALLARSSETHIAIHGASTHIAKTYGVSDADSHDAALAAARFLVSERWLMRKLSADEPAICQFGRLEAGTVCNAVAGEARLAGSLRVFSDEMFERAKREIRALLDEACGTCGCTGEVEFAEGYPPVVNDPVLYSQATDVLPELTLVEQPLLIAEDFAFYQRCLPGVFFLLGVGAPADGAAAEAGRCGDLGFATCALHGDTLMFDERVLLEGVSAYKRLVMMP